MTRSTPRKTADKKVETTPDAETVTPPATLSADEERSAALRKSYTDALTELREKHLDEFNVIRQRIAKDLGYDWTPPLTAQQKAERELEVLIASHPHLEESLRARFSVAAPD